MNWLRAGRLTSLLVLAALAYWGWSVFYFLTDDAYILFRYASNHLLGHGLVWNPEPFAPVEGYTSLLWVLLLEAVWRVFDLAPPQSANWLSLAFGYAGLWLLLAKLRRVQWPVAVAPWRDLIIGLSLLGIVSNRTFLTWLSSGLETSLFNFCMIWWLCAATAPTHRPGRWLFNLAISASCAALTRPDGLLFVGATLVLLALWRQRSLLPAFPLLVIPLHFAWRRAYYGLWLPNTYYAKGVGAAPGTGADYFFSFAIENGIVVWLLIAAAALLRKRTHSGVQPDPGAALRASVVAAPFVLHFAFYTLIIGGDHFEYRVYSHLIPLCFASAAWLAARAIPQPSFVLTSLALFVLASWPIPWTHWLQTRDLNTRQQTFQLTQPIAEHFPSWLQPLVAGWDRSQARLIASYVGVRHQEHKVFLQSQQRWLPRRELGARIAWSERAVFALGSVGMPGWVLPEVAIIDEFGLNDAVIARNPIVSSSARRMAHDRAPPPGYVECFRPNLRIEARRAVLVRRLAPLRDEDIRACEARNWTASPT